VITVTTLSITIQLSRKLEITLHTRDLIASYKCHCLAMYKIDIPTTAQFYCRTQYTHVSLQTYCPSTVN